MASPAEQPGAGESDDCSVAHLVLRRESSLTVESKSNSVRRMSITKVNWCGNQQFKYAREHHPSSVDEISSIVVAAQRVKVLGSSHSFNSSASADIGAEDTTDLICLDSYTAAHPPILDVAAQTVNVSAGATYSQVMAFLAPTGFALHNAASLPHISVGGAIATATHGSGTQNGNLSSAVVGLELVAADGKVLEISRTTVGDAFDGYVVHLGALGVVTRVTLRVVRAFDLRQDVYVNMPLREALENFSSIMSAGYSVSLFTTWSGDVIDQVWRKSITEPSHTLGGGMVATVTPIAFPPTWFGARLSAKKLHPIASVEPLSCTEQLGISGPWYARLPHFRDDFTPSVGDELQSEFFVAHADAPAAISAIHELRADIAPLLHVTEVRSIAADALWLSPAYGRDAVAIHFTWKRRDAEVAALLPSIELALAPFAPRPHWGKLFSISAEDLVARYSRAADFRALRRSLDPHDKFVNAYLRECGVVTEQYAVRRTA